jgi:hypothetical protein
MISEIEGIVTIVSVPVWITDNYILETQPSLHLSPKVILYGHNRAVCHVENELGDVADRTVDITHLKKLVVINERYCFKPSKAQIFSFRLFKEIGQKVTFPIFENSDIGFEIYPMEDWKRDRAVGNNHVC